MSTSPSLEQDQDQEAIYLKPKVLMISAENYEVLGSEPSENSSSPWDKVLSFFGFNNKNNGRHNDFETKNAPFFKNPVYPEFLKKCALQGQKALIDVFKANGIDVLLLPHSTTPPPPDCKWNDEPYAQDPISILRRTAEGFRGFEFEIPGTLLLVLLNTFKESRRGEPDAFYEKLKDTGWIDNARCVKMPKYIEGGDATIAHSEENGPCIVASLGGCSRNTKNALEAFSKATGLPLYTYRLKDWAFHIDVVYRKLANRKKVACPDAFINKAEYYRIIRDHAEYSLYTEEDIKAYIKENVIEVSEEDGKAYAVNLLELTNQYGDRHLFVHAITEEEREELIDQFLELGAAREDIEKILPSPVSEAFRTELKAKADCNIHFINLWAFVITGGAVHCITKSFNNLKQDEKRATPTNSSSIVSATWGVREGKQPDITITEENGALQIKVAEGFDLKRLSPEYKRFLEIVAQKPFSQISLEISKKQEEESYVPLFKTIQTALEDNVKGRKRVQINQTVCSKDDVTFSFENLKEEDFDYLVEKLYQFVGNESTKLPAWTPHSQLLDQVRDLQKFCGVIR